MTHVYLDAAMICDIGRRRSTNQDHGLASGGLFLVCDGMGGGVAGQEASARTIRHCESLIDRERRSKSDIAAVIDEAQRDVCELGRELGGISGTTLTGLVLSDMGNVVTGEPYSTRNDVSGFTDEDDDTIDGIAAVPDAVVTARLDLEDLNDDTIDSLPDANGTGFPCVLDFDADTMPSWYVVNIGDSRTYHLDAQPGGGWSASSMVQVTRDHSRRQELIDAGVMLPELADQLVPRNLITQCVGAPEGIDPDYFRADLPGRFIVCSDGLHSELDDDAIAAIAAVNRDPRETVQALVDAALAAGGKDNITVIVVDTVCSSTDVMASHDDNAAWSYVKIARNEDLSSISESTLDTLRTVAARHRPDNVRE